LRRINSLSPAALRQGRRSLSDREAAPRNESAALGDGLPRWRISLLLVPSVPRV